MIQTLSAAPSCASVRIHAASASSTTRRIVRTCATPAVIRRNVKLSVVQGRRGGARMGLLNRISCRAVGDDVPGAAPSLTDEEPEAAPTKVAKEEEELDLSQPPLLVAGLLASAGSAESAYLAFEKLTGGSVTCPVGGCQTALTSAWSTLFGLPLSLYGCAAYAGVAAVSFWGASMASKEQESDEMKTKYARARTLQFLGSCGLAAVSTYLLYVLAFELGGAECIYCLTSASISFALLAIGISGVRAQEVGRLAPPAVVFYIITVLSLSLVLGTDAPKTEDGFRLEYRPPSIEAQSTQYSRALATHLKERGAKMYGAFWCSHCEDQKETFGAGASDLPYVECFPDGWEKGAPLATACKGADITGFPTWVIGDKRFEGEKSLEELAEASGFRAPDAGGGALDAASLAADFLGQ